MKTIKFATFFFLVFTFLSCKSDKEPQLDIEPDDNYNTIVANSVDRDWKEIEKDSVLKALVVYSNTSYFLYKGQPMGFEYELLERLAKDLGLRLQLTVSENLDNEFEVLNRGDVDLIAHGMTITNQRKWEVDFTDYLYLTKQVLVQKKPDNFRNLSWGSLQKRLIKDPVELINDTISVRKNSSYYERILSLNNEIGGRIIIDTLSSHLTTDEIIDMVANGEIRYTVADENLAKINASYRPILDVSVPISFSQRIAWVTRKKSGELRNKINQWLKKQRKTTDYNVIYNKYFKNKRSFRRRVKSDYFSLSENQISSYDRLIKKHAETIGWDWRLIASQIYQESKFDPYSVSWAGAQGLLQIMPATAKAIGVTNPNDPNQSIKAGVKYLNINQGYFEEVTDSIEKIKLTLASYNCGLGHVQDAQTLAKLDGKDSNKWENIAPMLLALRFPKNYKKPEVKYGYVRGTEPVNYVNQIFERYEHYKRFIADEKPSNLSKN
ncbi:MAG: transporter substrate-binding domain-containing protein [Bacteroidota bacterium]